VVRTRPRVAISPGPSNPSPPFLPCHQFHPSGPGLLLPPEAALPLFHLRPLIHIYAMLAHNLRYSRARARVRVCDARVCVCPCASSGVVLRAKRYSRAVTETRKLHTGPIVPGPPYMPLPLTPAAASKFPRPPAALFVALLGPLGRTGLVDPTPACCPLPSRLLAISPFDWVSILTLGRHGMSCCRIWIYPPPVSTIDILRGMFDHEPTLQSNRV